MGETNIGSVIKTVLKVDQRLEAVKYALHAALEDEYDFREEHTGNAHPQNSFVLGWVKSFNIIMISITLSKESECCTTICVETANPGYDNKSKRIIHDGFYDFLSFLKHKLLPANIRGNIMSDESDYRSVWTWLFLILFVIFMGWYFFER